MGHIHNQPSHYDQAISFFIIKEEPKESFILLHRHRRLGKWFQPGGHLELNEHPWQTARHELLEETGYELDQLEVLQEGRPLIELQEILHPTPLLYRSHRYGSSEPPHYHTETTFGLLTFEEPRNSPAEGESQILRWFTRGELLDIPLNDINPDVRAIALKFLERYSRWHRVPADSYSLECPNLVE